MVDIIADSMDKIYESICRTIIANGRTVRNTKEKTNFSFTLTNLNNNVINIRDISKAYLCAELTWYLLGRDDVEFINPFAGLWGRISDDGIHSYSAYGDIVFKRHGFDQVDKMIELLTRDPESRRAVINFNVPNKNVIETKDEICTIALQYLIRDNQLDCTCIMRSNDIWYGLPYDTVFFTELQKFIAKRLKVNVGTYTHFVISLHCYDRNFEDMNKVINAVATEKISIDIEALNCYKRIVETEVMKIKDISKKRARIVDLCKELGILKVKELRRNEDED